MGDTPVDFGDLVGFEEGQMTGSPKDQARVAAEHSLAEKLMDLPVAALSEAGIDGRRRPETLAIPELVALSDVLSRAVL